MKRPKSDYAIQTVTNALRLLEAFQGEGEIGVTELGRRLGLHKNNVFRLLATLEDKGYVEQTESERYQLGVRCLELGQAFARTRSLVRLARPILESLSRSLSETVHLAVMRDFEVVHLAGEAPERAVVTTLRVGERLPVHCTALGKVLLGCASAGVLERFDREIVSRTGLTSRTDATVTDREKFFEQVRAVAGQGFSTEFEEWERGVCCASAPVYDGEDRLVAALSVSGPAFRLQPEVLLSEAVPAARAAADTLSRQLGHSGHSG